MKVEIDTAALADAVAWTSRVIDARPSNPILAGVKLEAIDGTLQFSAFNYEISARHHIEAGVDEAGSVLVQGKLLADITKSLRSEKTYLVTDGSTLTITSGKSKFTLQLMPDTEYPDLPVVPAMLGQVDAPTFVQAVNQACVAVSREENRPVLTGVRMQFQGDKVVMTSTDRFRLARATFTWTPQNPDVDTTTLVRGSLLKDVARALDEHQNIRLDFDADSPTLLGFENAGRVSTSQLIDGEFPGGRPPVRRRISDSGRSQQAGFARRHQPCGFGRRTQCSDSHDLHRSGSGAVRRIGRRGSGQRNTGHRHGWRRHHRGIQPVLPEGGSVAVTEPFVRIKMTTPVKPVEFNGQQEADSDESMDYRYLLVPMRFNN